MGILQFFGGLLLRVVKPVWKILKEDASPHQVGLGAAFAFIMAFQPFSLLFIALFIIFFVIKVNKSAGAISLFVFRIIAVIIEPLVVPVGAFILTLPALQGLWTALFNIPIAPLTGFNNTAAMGGLVVGVVLSPVIYVGAKICYKLYRNNLKEKIPFLRTKKKDENKKSNAAQNTNAPANA